MGHALSASSPSTCPATAVFVGLARLPQPLVSAVPSVVVELELDLTTQQIVDVNANLELPGLRRLLRELLQGKPLTPRLLDCLLELEVRYSASFSTAIVTAVRAAIKRALHRDVPCADALGSLQAGGARNGHLPTQHADARANGHGDDASVR